MIKYARKLLSNFDRDTHLPPLFLCAILIANVLYGESLSPLRSFVKRLVTPAEVEQKEQKTSLTDSDMVALRDYIKRFDELKARWAKIDPMDEERLGNHELMRRKALEAIKEQMNSIDDKLRITPVPKR